MASAGPQQRWGPLTPLRLWLLATVQVTSLSKVTWWHLRDFPKALCCLLLPVWPLLGRVASLGVDCSGGVSEKESLCDGTTRRVTTAQIPRRGVSDCWGRKTFLLRAEWLLQNPSLAWAFA